MQNYQPYNSQPGYAAAHTPPVSTAYVGQQPVVQPVVQQPMVQQVVQQPVVQTQYVQQEPQMVQRQWQTMGRMYTCSKFFHRRIAF